MIDPAEQLLSGFVDRIVRVGETIRRPAEPWTPAVIGLLNHYEAVGFELAPRHLGMDDQGRQIASFVPGVSVNERDVDAHAIGAAVRRLHDAGRGFAPAQGDAFHDGKQAAGPTEVYCHNDLGPWNIIGTDDAVTSFIDFDTASPKRPIWELADLAYRFGPLYSDEFLAGFDWRPSLEDRASRILALLDGYGWSRDRIDEIVSVLVPSLTEHAERLLTRARSTTGQAHKVSKEGVTIDLAARDWTRHHLPALRSTLRATSSR